MICFIAILGLPSPLESISSILSFNFSLEERIKFERFDIESPVFFMKKIQAIKSPIPTAYTKFQNVANSSHYSVTGALQVLSSDDFSYPITVGSTINNNVVNYTGQAAYTTGLQHAYTNLSVDVNATYPAGSILYPRYNVDLGSSNWRGNFIVNYHEVK